MKYTCEETINLPRAQVAELYDDPDNLKEWQPGLQSFELISGECATEGSKSKIRYLMGKREIEMIETLEVYRLPEEFTAVYETKGVWNRNENRFVDQGDSTKWVMDCEFTCSGFLKIMAFVMPGMFRKQTQKMMRDFKAFAEAKGA